MKYFIAIALIAAVASATVRPTPLTAEAAEIQEIIAAIQSPSTDPATAAALEQMLLDVLGVSALEGIAVGPVIIPFPLPDGGAVVEEPAIVPGPAVVAPAPAASPSGPLVQMIVNINQAAAVATEIKPEPVQVVDSVFPVVRPEPIGRPVPVGELELPAEPVHVVEAAPEPVQVVEVAPVPVEPVQIGVPVIPEAAVILPEELN